MFVFSILASGSDDQHVMVWDPLRHRKLMSMHTGHAANIFSVKVKSIVNVIISMSSCHPSCVYLQFSLVYKRLLVFEVHYYMTIAFIRVL